MIVTTPAPNGTIQLIAVSKRGSMSLGFPAEIKKTHPIVYQDYVKRGFYDTLAVGRPYVYQDALFTAFFLPIRNTVKGRIKLSDLEIGFKDMVNDYIGPITPALVVNVENFTGKGASYDDVLKLLHDVFGPLPDFSLYVI